MKTTKKIRSILLLSILGCFIFSIAGFAQQRDVNREVLIMFRKGTISPPTNAAQLPVSSATLPGTLVKQLSRFQVTELTRALPDFTATDTLQHITNGRVIHFPDYTQYFRVELPGGENRDSLINRLKKLPFVKYAEKNQPPSFMGSLVTPNDPYFYKQWNLKNTGQAGGTPGEDIDATEAWSITTGSSSVKLGIIDSGVLSTHEDLTGRVKRTSSVYYFHGTHVAGIAAANSNNTHGIAGVDWNAGIYSYEFDDIPTTVQSVNAAIADNVKVINCSWGYPDFSQSLYDAFRNGYENGALFIAASSESGKTGDSPQLFGPWIVNVGAMANTGAQATYSDNEPYLDVIAPGGNGGTNAEANIYSTMSTCNSCYDYEAGTSMAAPHVTGTATLMLAANPSLKNYDIEHILKRTASQYPTFDPGKGYGLINAYAALQRVVSPNQISHGNATFIETDHNVKRNFVNNPAPGLAAGPYYADVYKLEGSTTYSYSQTPWAWLSVTDKGYSGANPNNASRYMYESISTSSMDIDTFFYYLRTNIESGQTVDQWVPFDPTIFPTQYTVLGVPGTPPEPLTVSISGPQTLSQQDGIGYWSANVSGGVSPYSYQWQARNTCRTGYNCGSETWQPAGTQQTISYTYSSSVYSLELKVTVTDNQSTSTTSGIYTVYYDPPSYSLTATGPNPFNPTTNLSYALPEQADVTMEVYNIMGRKVATLADGSKQPGRYTVRFDASHLASGMYLVHFTARAASGQITRKTMKLQLLK